ncbi:helix-turn-helix domain-containing protein [Plantactinospora endophytica]|uniref:Transcriptional regulator n=1 Tax=Plantactinospora endophytica TaxID=673535 RepID=A0ABQ4DT30_9ACTN|nr:helix-turn-helix transcriptional regulator [Plantactinospora endophytica]GIG85618.1 transcriptional regulator [Plantactinospora endophytica]
MDQDRTTVPRRQLGRYLRRLRDEGGMTIRTAGEAIECSTVKIWRIESGLQQVRTPDVQALCDVYQAPPEVTETLVKLARQTADGWWQAYGDAVPDWFELYVSMEEATDRIRHYNGELVPGLLQTRRYMEEMMRIGRPDWTDDDRERRVELRLKRQRLLGRKRPAAPQLDVVLSEAVLRRPLADHAAMVEQLRHLTTLNERANVRIRILPLAVGPHRASIGGAFTLLTFPQPKRDRGDPPMIYQEGPTGALYLDRPEDIGVYDAIWRDLARLALSEAESIDVIDSFAGERR